jgi:uncharacterized membrane protein YeiH
MAFPAVSGELVLTLLEAAAVIASAIAGMIVASNKGMDLIGAYALACLNAFGGGTVRDLLLDNRPFYWMAHWPYLVAIGAICVPFVYNARMYRMASEVHRRSLKVDAIGLALFTITGVGLALKQGTPLVVALLMGVVTGTMGGMLRDIVVNEVPDLFRPGGLYASAALAGAIVFLIALENHVPYAYASLIGLVSIVVLRLVSVHLGLGIPKPQWIGDTKSGES